MDMDGFTWDAMENQSIMDALEYDRVNELVNSSESFEDIDEIGGYND